MEGARLVWEAGHVNLGLQCMERKVQSKSSAKLPTALTVIVPRILTTPDAVHKRGSQADGRDSTARLDDVLGGQ